MKKIYTALLALVLAITANAQSAYKLDSTFNSVGYKLYNIELPRTNIKGCVLNNDGTMIIAGESSTTSATNMRNAAKINANGNINNTLCGGICEDTIGKSSYTGVYKLGSNYYFASTGYGGDALIGNATILDNQAYDKNESKTTASALFDGNHIIEATSGQPTIYIYKVNTAGAGYGGAAGVINGASYPHGGILPAIAGTSLNGFTINSLGVQNNKSILAAGGMYVTSVNQTRPFIVRYKPNTLIMDSTFGTNGVVQLSNTSTEVYNMEIDANDNIYAFYGNGTDAKMTILNPNGSIKTTANQGGTLPMPWTIYNAVITKQGKILISVDGGPTDAKIISYDLNGNIDNTFYNGTNELMMTNVLPTFTYLTFGNVASDDYGNLAWYGYNNDTVGSGYIGTVLRLKTLFPVAPAGVNTIKVNAIDVHPNPATNQIVLENISPNSAVSITNMAGQQMKVNKLNVQTLDISNYPSGIYFVQINNGVQLFNGKFIKL